MAPFFTGIARRSGGFGKRKEKSLVTTIYTYTGSYSNTGPLTPIQNSVSIPADTTTVTINCIGGGAGSSQQGYGGQSQATFTNLAGKTLIAAIQGGGLGAYTYLFNSPSNNGFNYAGVFDGSVSQSNALVIAGGAGGAGSNSQSAPNNFTPGPSGTANGGGGNNNGNNGGLGWRNDYTTPGPSVGRGGTTTGGGAGGDASAPGGESGFAGSALQGGTGGRALPSAPAFDLGGAGGGGGWYGGGGAGGGYTDQPQPLATPLIAQSGGGGGSGYIHPTGTQTISQVGYVSATNGGSITLTIVELK